MIASSKGDTTCLPTVPEGDAVDPQVEEEGMVVDEAEESAKAAAAALIVAAAAATAAAGQATVDEEYTIIGFGGEVGTRGCEQVAREGCNPPCPIRLISHRGPLPHQAHLLWMILRKLG